MSKHTEDPWEVRMLTTQDRDGQSPDLIIVPSNDIETCICRMGNWPDERREELEANADLMAAAPKMVKALEEARTALLDAKYRRLPQEYATLVINTVVDALKLSGEKTATMDLKRGDYLHHFDEDGKHIVQCQHCGQDDIEVLTHIRTCPVRMESGWPYAPKDE